MDIDVVVKKEPLDAEIEDERNQSLSSGDAPSSNPAPVRYVSRRGRPPGGGYSMKSSSAYMSYNSAPLVTSADYARSSSSSLSPPDFLNATDNIDMRRFGFQSFDGDKNSFRCDGCDIVFASRDTYAMHMLMRAKNESCVALPSSAITSNPENPTPREKFERELRQQAMLAALRSQASAMTKAAAAAATASVLPKSAALTESLSALSRPATSALPESLSALSRSSTSALTESLSALSRSNTSALTESLNALSRSSTSALPESLSALTRSTNGALSDSLSALTRPASATKDRLGSSPDLTSLSSLFSLDTYGMYLDPRNYRRFLSEYGFR